MVQGLLIDMVVVQPVIAFERSFKVFPRVEPMRVENIAYATIEALDHAIRLRPIRRYQPMVDAVLATEPINFMPATGLPLTTRGEAISKGLAVIG